ncbi:LysR family transcriptional regulator [Cohnella sp. AR92]|uniref:LysR family transcriptional regulator n=1 Tax=Cohnella sp. AR92 TaxID=648716 RepID=UPI000F8CA673|nr:LysR family transcriptional regulator [Cohnella sp. AR92]RUS46311.1 LysR family transcriptional regulator [Cohnella sp. AR92]
MNIDQLEYILEIAKTRSLSAAANNLYVSVPALSQAVTHLETELEVKLFERSRAGTVPTAEGQALLQRAAVILEKIREFKEEARSFSETLSGELRLAAIPGPMSHLVKTLAGFKRDYPNVRIEVSEMSSQEIIRDLEQHKVDLGLIVLYEDLKHVRDQFEFVKVIDAKLICFLNKSHRLAHQQAVRIEDFHRYPMVLYKEDYLIWFMEQFGRLHGPANVVFTSNNVNAIIGALREEMAFSIGLDYTFRNGSVYEGLTEDMAYKEMEVPSNLPVQLGWVTHRNAAESRILKLFIDRLKLQFLNDT